MEIVEGWLKVIEGCEAVDSGGARVEKGSDGSMEGRSASAEVSAGSFQCWRQERSERMDSDEVRLGELVVCGVAEVHRLARGNGLRGGGEGSW